MELRDINVGEVDCLSIDKLKIVIIVKSRTIEKTFASELDLSKELKRWIHGKAPSRSKRIARGPGKRSGGLEG